MEKDQDCGRDIVMIRNNLLSRLAELEGASVAGLLQGTDIVANAETSAAAEILLQYSPDVVFDDDKWKLARASRSATILAAINNYSVSSGRKIFRLSSALAQIPPHEHPNEDELKAALELSLGEYELLPNAMIKRN
jgi:hypothetical protein